ncbi:MAG: RluA family pseudouridine synthase [Lachnospiraceae bacterium]|uniref:RluA family pseudouridine synthase n=1 Tax=Parablautia sp. Marseille-Q6255 TaxID=3039593 RepID=UPI0024BCC662|nr:RluA family pseudouridine synthase [Parablautia sp. Marseille-Q6255]
MERREEMKIDAAGSKKRLDRLLADAFPQLTRSYLQNLIRNGCVKVDGKPAKASLKAGEGAIVQIDFPELEELSVEPENIPLDILYEDEDLIIVNKPKGMVVHPAAGHYSGTLVNALLYHCHDSLSGINGVLRPGIVHRIDQNTTGSLIVCKNDAAHQAIADQLAVHSITRKYRAIVHGRLKEDGTVHTTIGRHPLHRKEMAVNVPNGKDAVTHYRILQTFDRFTYIECSLETGRTHQIRVHMKSIGHPILGDDVYGPARCPFKNLQGQTLHAMTIGFIHPRTQEYMEFEAPLPEYFEHLLKSLQSCV